MDADDRRAIEDLFAKLRAVERRSPPRDREAERFIDAAVGDAPAAPYYMAQTIIVQERALETANRRIEELERSAGDGRQSGLLGGLFGGRPRGRERYEADQDERRRAGPWNAPAGGGFLAGAAQTAMGVAGGVILGNLIGGALFGQDAHADERQSSDADDRDRDDDGGGHDGDSDSGDDFGGDFGGDF